MSKTATATATKPKQKSTALAVPGFSQSLMPRKKVNQGGSGDAFVWVAHPMSKEMWGEVSGKIPGLKEFQFVFCGGIQTERLQPMKFHVLEAFHYYATLGEDFQPDTVYDEDSETRPKEAIEFVEALLAVYTKQGLKPARVTFKRGVCGAIAPMIDEALACESAEWAGRSTDHKHAAKINPPAFRFFGEASNTPVTNKKGTFTYGKGNCRVSPSTSTEVAVIKDMDVEAFNVALESSRVAFRTRIADLKSKM